MKLHVFAKKSQADFAANNCIRKRFLLQATFTRDVIAIFPKFISFPQYMYLHAHFQTPLSTRPVNTKKYTIEKITSGKNIIYTGKTKESILVFYNNNITLPVVYIINISDTCKLKIFYGTNVWTMSFLSPPSCGLFIGTFRFGSLTLCSVVWCF